MTEEAPDHPAASDRKGATANTNRALGLPDSAFEQRRPLKGQITKREVRAISLYSLGLRPGSIVWDIGAGTGSITVEAALIAHQGAVFAIERDETSLTLLRHNIDRWGTANINIVLGEAPGVLDGLTDPDSVFVGGSGGRLEEILTTVGRRLNHGGHIVVNLAALERAQEACNLLKGLNFSVEMVMVSAARGKEMDDGATRLESLNPVFVVTACIEE